LQNFQHWWIFFNYWIIFLLKSRGICPRHRRLGPWDFKWAGLMWAIKSHMDARDSIAKGYVFLAVENKMDGRYFINSITNLGHQWLIERLGLNNAKGIEFPNLGRASEIGWLGGFSDLTGQATQGPGRHHGQRHGGAQARAKMLKMKQGFFLHVLDYERNLFCPLTEVEPGHKRWSTRRRLGPRLAAVMSSFGEARPSRSSPTSSSWPPLASRLVQWLQSATNSSNLVAARV
jgi:hypothetical protein